MNWLLKQIRKLVIIIVGGTVLVVGVLMIVGPGPAFIVIPAGIAILAIEFAWARLFLKKAKKYIAEQSARFKNGSNPDKPSQPPA
jgi:tellurite resistance protein TerC